MQNDEWLSGRKKDLLREFCLAFGPSGCEEEIAGLAVKYGSELGGEMVRDRMGNVTFTYKPAIASDKPEKILVSSHMDEVGFMITGVTAEGYLKFTPVGGIDPRVLCGRNVTLSHEGRKTKGVILSKAIHHQTAEERKKVTKVAAMLIDIGATNEKEAKELVDIGDFGTFDSAFYTFGKEEKLVKSKALDDRAGCVLMLLTMEKLANGTLVSDKEITFAFTVREEVGLSGAKVTAQRLEPDRAIILETTAVGDISDVPPAKRVADVGKGGVLSVMDRSTVYPIEDVRAAVGIAEAKQIPVQIKRYVSGGNDAGSIFKTCRGVRVLALSAPTRYLHSPACVASLDDFAAMEALLAALLESKEV